MSHQLLEQGSSPHSRTIYFFGVTRWGDLSALVYSPWSFSIEPAMTGLAALAVQGFYAYRIYIISSRKVWIPAIIGAGSVVQFGECARGSFADAAADPSA